MILHKCASSRMNADRFAYRAKSQLARARRRLNRIEWSERRLSMDFRKADTCRNIQLSELVVKTDLAEEEIATLLDLWLAATKARLALDGAAAWLARSFASFCITAHWVAWCRKNLQP
jgi:hypothetical protein